MNNDFRGILGGMLQSRPMGFSQRYAQPHMPPSMPSPGVTPSAPPAAASTQPPVSPFANNNPIGSPAWSNQVLNSGTPVNFMQPWEQQLWYAVNGGGGMNR